jgi:triosephosphate isomerase
VGVSLKMYLGVEETRRWLEAVARVPRGGVELFVLPTFLSLEAAHGILGGTGVRLGAQDVFWDERGPFTGEVSPSMLREVGCHYVAVGHAERRRLFGEDDAVTARKAAAAAEAGLVPVVCVGETERSDSAAAAGECARQVRAALRALPDGAAAVVAYEPVWAIGAAAPAPAEHVVRVARRLRPLLERRQGETRLLYGGSAGPGAFASLADAVDGLFLGRFAHDVGNLGRVLDEVGS